MTINKKVTTVLDIYLGETRVGYLSSTKETKNIFIFDEDYINLGRAVCLRH